MKNNILKILRWLYSCFLLCFNTMLSVFRIFLYSKLYTRNPQLKDFKNQVFVLGNGPSLSQLIEKDLQFLRTQNIVVVNDFFLNDYFSILKPRIYVIADPGYWEVKVSMDMFTLRQKMQFTLINAVDWDMEFYIPTAAYQSGFYRNFQSNPRLHIHPYNTTSFVGTKRMRYFFYDKLLAKPFSGNVVGSALFIALQMNIQEILLFGVEHSWSRNVFVDEQNRTCIQNEHSYDSNQQANVWLKSNTEPYTINEALIDIANMLGGYREIRNYAQYKNINIYNCTPDSYIDAFERKKWKI